MMFCDVSDAKELAELAESIWMEYFPTIINRDETEYIMNKFQSEKAIEQQIKNGYLYAFIKSGNKKAGYLCILPEKDSLFISKLYVSKDLRGTGLGSQALGEILDKGRAMKKKKAYLRVNRFNTLAIGVYEHTGFVITKEEKSYIGDGFFMDDYVMEYSF